MTAKRKEVIDYMRSLNWDPSDDEIYIVYSDVCTKSADYHRIVDMWYRAKQMAGEKFRTQIKSLEPESSIDYIRMLRIKQFGIESTRKWLCAHNEDAEWLKLYE